MLILCMTKVLYSKVRKFKDFFLQWHWYQFLLLNFFLIDFQSKIVLPVDNTGQPNMRKVLELLQCVFVVCIRILQRLSAELVAKREWKCRVIVSVIFSLITSSFLLYIKNYIKIKRKGVVKKKMTCHVKDIQQLHRLTCI